MASKDDGEDSNANPFDVNSDDDDGKENRDGRRSQGQPRQDTHKKAPSSDALCGSVVYKPGRSLNASLYYFDHGKKPGLSPSEQGELASKLAVSTAKRDALEDELNATLFSTRKLANEPTNLDLETRLDEHESTVSQYRIEVEDARKLQVNQEHKARTKRKITKMTTVWRSRKRICLDFMNHLEEVTDGMVSARKCFKGDGQISLDSDEVVRDGAIRFEKDKRDRKRMLGDRMKTNALRASHAKLMAGSSLKGPRSAQHSKRATGAMASDLANPDFVAVMLNSQGHVQRVHLDADEIRSKSSSG
uniref:Uncharacterized protein n=1 Tax=Craspedostauros australis TaxID=1486917 RepID=A0A7R9ZKT6_9STRA|mmetsp:Transcript_16848/g.46546  ORF Transcript_16848/g.46546 Transcript_16848/m.46546 type:complete len:304 (+) Transcript_16848:75-986(+)